MSRSDINLPEEIKCDGGEGRKKKRGRGRERVNGKMKWTKIRPRAGGSQNFLSGRTV